MEAAALEVRGLTRSYGARKAVDALDLTVQAGDVYGFLGPNGAGKTTAMRCILGLIPYDAGEIAMFGESDPVERRRGVGAVVETPAFHGWMSGLDNLKQAAWYAGLSGKTADTEIARVLDRVGLSDRRDDRTRGYSLGMKQRLGVARALLGKPRMLFLDEPTNGLDPAGMKEVRDLVRSLAIHDRITVFVSSHLLAEVQAICNRVAILQHGKLRAEGAVDALLAAGGDPIYALRAEDPEALRAALALADDIRVLTDEDAAIRVQTARKPAALNAWLHDQGVSLAGLATETRSLEDVFMEAVQ
ncbi:MAG: ABC transporter ATP-binding protein [Alphaproteobacteria bacterium]|nr:ABC transporter ATP-binding protein [Alphaproteobacteria bacterium]